MIAILEWHRNPLSFVIAQHISIIHYYAVFVKVFENRSQDNCIFEYKRKGTAETDGSPNRYVLCFKTVNISVAPVIPTAVVTVKGKPIAAGTASCFNRYDRSPTAETAVGVIKSSSLHAILAVYAVFRRGFKVIPADEMQLAVNF